jgi:hypothetical protein
VVPLPDGVGGTVVVLDPVLGCVVVPRAPATPACTPEPHAASPNPQTLTTTIKPLNDDAMSSTIRVDYEQVGAN